MSSWKPQFGPLSERGCAAESGRTDLTGDIAWSDRAPVPPRSESSLRIPMVEPVERGRKVTVTL